MCQLSRPAEAVTLADLEADPHPLLARLRAAAPVCWVPVLGAWLARPETLIAIQTLFDELPRPRLDPGYLSAPRGLVFRKPAALRVRWNAS